MKRSGGIHKTEFKYFVACLKQIFVRDPVGASGLDECLNVGSVGIDIARDYLLSVDRVFFDLVHQLTDPNSVTEKEIYLYGALKMEMKLFSFTHTRSLF